MREPERGKGLLIATPYREGAVLAIARAAARRGELQRLYTTIYTGKLVPRARVIPFSRVRSRVEGELARRRLTGIPDDRVSTKARGAEAAAIVARRIPHAQSLASRLMYRSKDLFDRDVAQAVPRDGGSAVVAMFASAEHTLGAARKSARFAVLNFVNSHPEYHNRYLREFAGLSHGHRELVPEPVAARVQREIDVADLLLVPSRFVANQLVELGVDNQRIALRPYGVDLSGFHPAVGEPSPGRSRVRCLFVGQISHRKGIVPLLRAARLLTAHPIEFILVGPMVSREVLRDGVPENVRYLGATVHEGVAAMMRSADIFILPSIEDACPLVVLEAMATGLPTITTDHCGAGEFIDNGVDGVVVPAGDAEALSRAVEMLAGDPLLRASMASAARRRVAEGHSWDEYGDGILDLIGSRGGTDDAGGVGR